MFRRLCTCLVHRPIRRDEQIQDRTATVVQNLLWECTFGWEKRPDAAPGGVLVQ
jgi:hypothetical protein